MARKTTLHQLAEAAGVSISTVDRVLNRRGGVSSAKEAKVMEWAARLNLDRVLFRDYLKVLRVAVMMQSPKNPFYQGLRDAFDDMNTAMSDMKINCFIHYIDISDMASTMNKIKHIGDTYDALIVVCPNDQQLSDALRVISRRIPIVTLVTDLPNSGRIAYVGPDNRQTGRVAGELMGRFLGAEGGEILIVLGMQRITGHEEREMGFRSVLRERFPACRIVASLESGEMPGRVADVVGRALRKHPEIRGLYNVSAGNTSIAETIRAMNLAHRITLITHELTAEHRSMLRDGVIDAVLDQNPSLEARRALEVLGKYFSRVEGEIQPNDYTPFSIYIRENCPPATW